MTLLDQLQLAWVKASLGRRIRRHGWSGVYIGDYETPPSWAYTQGFDETLDHPELVVFDLPRPSATQLFGQVFQQVKAGALVIEDGLIWPPGEERPCVWRKVHPGHVGEWLTLACMRRLMRSGFAYGLEAYQLVLSDSEGKLPWEAGYDERLRPLQRALYLAPDNSEVAASGGV